MPDYTLTLNVAPSDLRNIKLANQRIALAKPVADRAGNIQLNVIWLSIDPFEATTIEWSEEYWIYASTSVVQAGTPIRKISETVGAASDGGYYAFDSSTTFREFQKTSSIAGGTYSAKNLVPHSQYPMLTFGLAQSALIGSQEVSGNPISATSVLSLQDVDMTPLTHVYIWLQSYARSNTIITSVTGNRAVAQFGDGVTDISLDYDPYKGVFVGNGSTIDQPANSDSL